MQALCKLVKPALIFIFLFAVIDSSYAWIGNAKDITYILSDNASTNASIDLRVDVTFLRNLLDSVYPTIALVQGWINTNSTADRAYTDTRISSIVNITDNRSLVRCQNSSNITCINGVITTNISIPASSGGADGLGNHTASQDLNMNNKNINTTNIIYSKGLYGLSSSDAVKVGTTSNGIAATTNIDLYVKGVLEVAGSYVEQYANTPSYFLYNSNSGSWITIVLSWINGNAQDSAIIADLSKDQFIIHVTANTGRQFILSSGVSDIYSYYRDYDHPIQSNPTQYFQSSTDPDIDNTQWLSLTHNKTEGVIETGNGSITLKPQNGIVYIIGNSTADAHIDYTPAYQGTTKEALAEINNVKSLTKNGAKEIDHSSLPTLAQAKVPIKIRENCIKLCMDCSKDNCSTANYHLPYKEEYSNQSLITKEDGTQSGFMCEEFCDERTEQKDGRNLGGMITVLTEAVKELSSENELLRFELCRKDLTYGFCK